MDKSGVDSEGYLYETPDELWSIVRDKRKFAEEEGQEGEEPTGVWYCSAVKYWDQQAATNNGVLGGFGQVNPADIMDSRKFLIKAYLTQLKEAEAKGRSTVAADCGAGIGRVSAMLLMHYFKEVDIVEPSGRLTFVLIFLYY